VNKSTFLATLLIAALCMPSLQSPAEAAEFRSGVTVTIGSDEVLNDDVYAVAGRIVIDGTIDGDLLAAGEDIEINGAVNGDLIVAGRAITINGDVEDDIRAAGSELRFASSIGGDLIVAGDQVEIVPDSVIKEDLVAGANRLTVSGDVEGNLDLSVTEASIDGNVHGNVEATVEESLVLGPESRIGGELNYISLDDVTMQTGAEVSGDITKQVPMIEIFGKEYPISFFIQIVSKIISQAKWFIGTLLVGLVLIWLFPATIQNVVATLSGSPFKSLGIGVLVFPIVPIALLFTMIIALSTIGFSGFPMVAIPATAYVVLLLLAKPTLAMALGGYILRIFTKQENFKPRSALVVGAAILAGIGLFPYADSVVGWLALILGFGMWLLFFHRNYREARVTQRA